MMNIFEGDRADRAAVIRLIRQGFARVGLEADQPDRDRVSSDQGFLTGTLFLCSLDIPSHSCSFRQKNL